MASTTMTASSFSSGSALAITKPHSSTSRCLIVAKVVSTASEGEGGSLQIKNNETERSGRREVITAAAAAAALSIAKVAMAEEEPKRGTPEAKKKYAPVCVTMPTARICRN